MFAHDVNVCCSAVLKIYIYIYIYPRSSVFFAEEDFREDILLLMFCGSEGQWVHLRESQKVTQKPRFLPQLYGLPGHFVSINKFRDKALYTVIITP